MSERLIDRIPFAKIVTVLAIVIAISLGLCGVTFFISSGGGRGGGFLIGFGMLELAANVLSAVGVVATIVVWIALSVFDNCNHKESEPLRLFDDKKDKNQPS